MVHNSKMQDVFFSSPFSLLIPQTNLLDQQVMQLLQLLHWSSGEQMWLWVRQKRSLESLSVSLSMKKQRTWVKALIHFCQFTCSALMRQVAKCMMSWTGQSCHIITKRQGCSLSKIAGSPVLRVPSLWFLWKKLWFSSHPEAKVRCHGPLATARAQPW